MFVKIIFLLSFLSGVSETMANCVLPKVKGTHSYSGFMNKNILKDEACATLTCEYYDIQEENIPPVTKELILGGKSTGHAAAVIHCIGGMAMFCVSKKASCHRKNFTDSNCFVNPTKVECETRFTDHSTSRNVLFGGCLLVFFVWTLHSELVFYFEQKRKEILTKELDPMSLVVQATFWSFLVLPIWLSELFIHWAFFLMSSPILFPAIFFTGCIADTPLCLVLQAVTVITLVLFRTIFDVIQPFLNVTPNSVHTLIYFKPVFPIILLLIVYAVVILFHLYKKSRIINIYSKQTKLRRLNTKEEPH